MSRLLAIVGFLAVGFSSLPGAPSETGDVATIVNSGSTNRPGFRIAVDASGAAELTYAPRRSAAPQQAGPIRQTLPDSLVEAFYADLKAAAPLDSLPPVHCAKSVSFGTTLKVAFDQEETPDLSCGDGGNPAMRNLIRDTRQIVAVMQAR